MSATLRMRKVLVREGSPGGSRVTSGLSSVGPPPTLRINQLLWNYNLRGSRSLTTSAPNTSLYHSREVSWSRTTRKWVTITPSRGAGMSSRFILLSSFGSGPPVRASVVLATSQPFEDRADSPMRIRLLGEGVVGVSSLRAATQHPARSSAAPLGRPVGLKSYASIVLEVGGLVLFHPSAHGLDLSFGK
jgi:hypothetical protein